MKKTRFIICSVIIITMIVSNLPIVTFASAQPFDGTILESVSWGMWEDKTLSLLSGRGFEMGWVGGISYKYGESFEFLPGIVGDSTIFSFFQDDIEPENDHLFEVYICAHVDYSEVMYNKWKNKLSDLYGEPHDYNMDDARRETLLFNNMFGLDDGKIVTDEDILNYYVSDLYENQLYSKTNKITWELSDGTSVYLYESPGDSVWLYYSAPFELFL